MELTKEVKLFGQKLLISQSSFNNVFIELIEDAVSTVELSDGTKIEVDLKEVINNVINTQLRLFIPYKFEQLKLDMFVYDVQNEFVYQIADIQCGETLLLYNEGAEDGLETVHFEEKRYYPVLTYKSLLEKDNEEE